MLFAVVLIIMADITRRRRRRVRRTARCIKRSVGVANVVVVVVVGDREKAKF